MNWQRPLTAVILLIAVTLVAGCHGDPVVRKQRYLESGKRFSFEGRYREAAIQDLNALKVDEDYFEAHYELARTYQHLGEFAAATEELSHAVQLQPSNYNARVDLGNLLFATGRTDDAQVQANLVMAAQPDNPGVHALLSAIAARRGKRDQALAEIHRALELDPNQSAFHEDLALLEAGDQSMSSSIEDELKKSVELSPKSVDNKLLLAAFYSRNNRLLEAEKISWDAVETNSESLAAWTNVAQVILKQGDRARAELVLREASKQLVNNPEAAVILADYYVNSGQLDKATQEFSSLAVRYPRNSSVQKRYVRFLLQVGNYSAARTVLAGLAKNGSPDPEVEALNGILLLDDRGASDAINALQDSVGNFPDSALIQYWLGKAALAKGDSSLAEKSFRQAAELDPADRDAEEELARIARRHGDMSLLAEVSENTIAALPQLSRGYVWRSIVEVNRNSPDNAEEDLKTALTLDPQSWQACLHLGKLRFAQKRFSEGVALFEQALRYNPDSVPALRSLVVYDLYRKQPEKALARVNAQIARDPGNSRVYDLLAQLQFQNRNLDQAADTAEKAIQLNSGDGEAVTLFAQIAVQRGQTAKVVAAREHWLTAHPGDAGTLAILGALEESRGNLSKAESYYKRSLQIEPRQPIAANNLAYRMLLKGEMPNEALALAQTARQGMPESPYTADTLAWAYYFNGTYEFARNLLENAITTNPDSATMQYHLGMVYSKLHDKNNAAIHFRKAISLERDTQIAKEARAALQGLS
jgi:Tfp pilus assembly protein PilF